MFHHRLGVVWHSAAAQTALPKCAHALALTVLTSLNVALL